MKLVLALFSYIFAFLLLFEWHKPVNANVAEILQPNTVSIASYRFRGREYHCVVLETNYFNSSKWNPALGDPPLSPRSALSLAEQHARRLVPDAASFRAQEILLRNLLGVWHYIVQLEPSNPAAPYAAATMEPVKIAILMDGTIVERVRRN